MGLQVPPNCDLTLGVTCLDKSVPGRTVWTMDVDERFLNPAGVLQGGFLGALADSAMGASVVTALRGRRALVSNFEMKLSLLAPVRPGATLTCRATVEKLGSRLAFVDATIEDEKGQRVASARSTYLIKDRAE